MTITYGIDPVTGVFTRKPAAKILSDIAAYQRANIDPTLKSDSSDSIVGKLNASMVAELDAMWQELETSYNGFDPDAAESRLLEMLCNLTSTDRRGASAGTVPLTVTLAKGTTLVAGTHFSAVTGHADVRFTPVVDFTATADGAVTGVLFQCEQTGPIEAVAGSIAVIATPVVGWSAVSQPEDVTPGRVVDDDPTLRARRVIELGRFGASTVRAIRANVLAADNRIEDVLVRENARDSFDFVQVMPPHSVGAIVDDGPTAPVPNDVIAQVLYDSVAGGINTVGNTSGTAVVDEDGNTEEMRFSRAVGRDVYLAFTLSQLPKGYPGDDAVKQAIADYLTGTHRLADGVASSQVFASPFALQAAGIIGGIKEVVSFALDFTALPVATADLPIGALERARFDTSRITIVIV